MTDLPSGWTIKEAILDSEGKDSNGWKWGLQAKSLWYATDGIDSVTVRANNEADAVAQMAWDGWPPRLVRRLGWEYNE